MSKGPGRIERTVAAVFAEGANRAFTVEDLARATYPSVTQPAKRHRVAVLRAAAAVAARLGWATYRAPAPHPLVYADPTSIRGHAMAKLRTSPEARHLTDVDLARLLDDPAMPASRWRAVQPGGEWWTQAEMARAYRERRPGDALVLLERFRAGAPV